MTGPLPTPHPDTDWFQSHPPPPPGVHRIAVVTGSRAEFGLLRPVMRAIAAQPTLQLAVIAAGSHFLKPSETWREVKAEFHLADIAPMQSAPSLSRLDDAEALAKGLGRFARSFARLQPACVVVLGDRIEAFAAAAAASIAGFPLAHIHGGDRAEGIADEAMRHAITKLAHLHFPASPASAQRILRLGEDPASVHTVGSPALDDLPSIPALSDPAAAQLGDPALVILLHPAGLAATAERATAAAVLAAATAVAPRHVLALAPNADPGRAEIHAVFSAAASENLITYREHLPRPVFIALLKRLAAHSPPRRGVLVGNSSAGLIEAAALALPVVNLLPRQAGRESAANVIHLPAFGFDSHPAMSRATPSADSQVINAPPAEYSSQVASAVRDAQQRPPTPIIHPFGAADAGARIASILTQTLARSPINLRKRCSY